MGTLFSSDEKKVKALVSDDAKVTSYEDILEIVKKWNKDTPYYEAEKKRLSQLTAKNFYEEYTKIYNINAKRFLWAKAVCMDEIKRLLQETWINDEYTYSQWTDIFIDGGNNPLIRGKFHFPVDEISVGRQQVNILCMAIIQGCGKTVTMDLELIGHALDIIKGEPTLVNDILLKPMGKMITGKKSIFIKETTPYQMFHESLLPHSKWSYNSKARDALIAQLYDFKIPLDYKYPAIIIIIKTNEDQTSVLPTNLSWMTSLKINETNITQKLSLDINYPPPPTEMYSACKRCGKRSRRAKKKMDR